MAIFLSLITVPITAIYLIKTDWQLFTATNIIPVKLHYIIERKFKL